jgi:hypothetical protein
MGLLRPLWHAAAPTSSTRTGMTTPMTGDFYCADCWESDEAG